MNSFPGFAKLLSSKGDEFFIKTSTLILGRNTAKCLNNPSFCPLSTSKQISRKHAKIIFDDKKCEFQIFCICKKDIFVDNNLLSCEESPKTLKNGSSFVIGDFPLMFVLPKDFNKQRQIFFDSKLFIIDFDIDALKTLPKQVQNARSPFSDFDKPQEKMVTLIKNIISESSSKLMNFDQICGLIYSRYSEKHKEWLEKYPWKNSVRKLLNNKRNFTSITSKELDTNKRPIFVEKWTVKRFAGRFSRDQGPGFSMHNSAAPTDKSSFYNMSKMENIQQRKQVSSQMKRMYPMPNVHPSGKISYQQVHSQYKNFPPPFNAINTSQKRTIPISTTYFQNYPQAKRPKQSTSTDRMDYGFFPGSSSSQNFMDAISMDTQSRERFPISTNHNNAGMESMAVPRGYGSGRQIGFGNKGIYSQPQLNIANTKYPNYAGLRRAAMPSAVPSNFQSIGSNITLGNMTQLGSYQGNGEKILAAAAAYKSTSQNRNFPTERKPHPQNLLKSPNLLGTIGSAESVKLNSDASAQRQKIEQIRGYKRFDLGNPDGAGRM